MLSRTNLTNGLSVNSTIRSVMPWWQTALYVLDVVMAVLTAGCAVMLFRSGKHPVIEVKDGGKKTGR